MQRCATLGDLRERIKDIAGLIGSSVTEEGVWLGNRFKKKLRLALTLVFSGTIMMF